MYGRSLCFVLKDKVVIYTCNSSLKFKVKLCVLIGVHFVLFSYRCIFFKVGS